MRAFWEQTGVLLPICRLAVSGNIDAEIAEKLNVTEASVQSGGMTWLLHFLKLNSESIDSASIWFPHVTLIVKAEM